MLLQRWNHSWRGLDAAHCQRTHRPVLCRGGRTLFGRIFAPEWGRSSAIAVARGRNHIHPAVHRVQDAIAGALKESWTLSRLATIAGAGNRHLSRLFHDNVGMSIKDYTNRLRVALAKELLTQTRLDTLTWSAWRNALALPLHANCDGLGEESIPHLPDWHESRVHRFYGRG